MEKFSPARKGLILLFSLVFVFSPLQAEQIKPPLIATGFYFDGELRRPLLLQSLDLGQSWEYPLAIHEKMLPSDFFDGGLTKSSCSKTLCIATGIYYNNLASHVPLLIQSQDRGLNWSFQAIKNANFQRGWFNDSTCKEQNCFAVGLFESINGFCPLLALSDLNGVWHYSKSLIKKLPLGFKEGWFNSISCNASECVAAGTYTDTKAFKHPLIMVSQNNGSNWKAAGTKNFARNLEAHLYGSACDQSFCVAVGEFTDSQKSVTPLIMQSTAAKNSWIKSVFPLPSDFLSGWFNAVDCEANFCIAVGNYNNGEIIQPLLVFSDDGGAHWQLKKSIADDELGTHLEYGSYMSASCSETGCIAGGSFQNYFNTYPLITVSHDKGKSWFSPPSARVSVPAAELGNGYFGKVKCLLETCIAAGDYTIDSAYYPLLALSTDGGLSWNFPESINSPDTLPKNFINGHF